MTAYLSASYFPSLPHLGLLSHLSDADEGEFCSDALEQCEHSQSPFLPLALSQPKAHAMNLGLSGKRIQRFIFSLCMVSPVFSQAADLQAIYQQALKNNGAYQAAKSTYQAASYGVPISRANLLPSLVLTANTTDNHQSPDTPAQYNTNGYALTLTQPLLNIGSWYSYSVAEANYKAAAITFAGAEQSLVMSVASDYFAVLQAEDQLKYARSNEDALAQQMKQTQVEYSVGLKARSDLEATQASYQSAIAQTIVAQNTLDNAMGNLSALTGQPEQSLAPLNHRFPLLSPQPKNSEAWVHFALQHNLNNQAAAFQSEIARLNIRVDTTTGYLPTVNVVGSYSDNKALGSSTDSVGRNKAKSASLQLAWNIFSGGSTAATVKQDQYTYQATLATQEQTRRNVSASVRQAYLSVLADISQVQAYQQAVVSNQASLKAMKAGYTVGTRTIVDVLTQQSNFFSSQQQYATAVYAYITDSLNLKEQAGTLSPQDISAINAWLDLAAPVSAS